MSSDIHLAHCSNTTSFIVDVVIIVAVVSTKHSLLFCTLQQAITNYLYHQHCCAEEGEIEAT